MKADIFHVYAASYVDLIMGTAVSVAYVKIQDALGIFPKYLESSTINYAEIVALNRGLERVPDSSDYFIHINNRYVQAVLLNCQAWRSQGILDEKAHSEEVLKTLTHLDRLGTGRIELTPHVRHRDEFMMRLLKHCKHFYHQVQLEMITRLTSGLDPYFFGRQEIVDVKELAGSVLWKSPLSMTEFQKKMQKARLGQQQTNPSKVVRLQLVE